MNDDADGDIDGFRPLSNEERIAVRKLLRIITEDTRIRALEKLLHVVAEDARIQALEKLIANTPTLVDISTAVAHMNWFNRMIYKVAIWFVAFVAMIAAWPTFKLWIGLR